MKQSAIEAEFARVHEKLNQMCRQHVVLNMHLKSINYALQILLDSPNDRGMVKDAMKSLHGSIDRRLPSWARKEN